ncbi:MAG: biotin--[acetyl-CoA-carboxylase] ligase [Nitrososphaerales archaeon]
MADPKRSTVQSRQRDFVLEESIKRKIRESKFKKLVELRPFCSVSIDSTQNFLAEYLQSSHEGDFALSRIQTGGRGRESRRWISESGGLWFSITLAPRQPDILDRIVRMAASAIVKTLQEDYSLGTCSIKAPNDVYCSGKKIAGILADAIIKGEGFVVYLGLGVNLNNDPARNPELAEIATSYSKETGKQVDIEEFLMKLLSNLDQKYDELVTA